MRELAHELLDTQDTGYVSLVRINESLAAFGQKELSAEDEASGVDFTQHAETAYAEGVYGQQQSRRSLFAPRPDGSEAG